MVAKYLHSGHSTPMYALLEKLVFEEGNHFALYMLIFSIVDIRRDAGIITTGTKNALAPGVMAYLLKCMLLQLLRLPGAITSSLARGDKNGAQTKEVYKSFRATYKHWFDTYVRTSHKWFNSQEMFKFKNILEGFDGDKGVIALQSTIINNLHKVPECDAWVRVCTFDSANHRIGFVTSDRSEHRQWNKVVKENCNAECWEEVLSVVKDCSTWDEFWAMGLEELIPQNLLRLGEPDGKSANRVLRTATAKGLSAVASEPDATATKLAKLTFTDSKTADASTGNSSNAASSSNAQLPPPSRSSTDLEDSNSNTELVITTDANATAETTGDSAK